jgi:hypothetical protein
MTEKGSNDGRRMTNDEGGAMEKFIANSYKIEKATFEG